MRRSLPFVLAVTTVLAALLLVAPLSARAQTGGVVEGWIVNGTAGASLPEEGLEVTLHVLRQMDQVAVMRSEVRPGGSFRFEDVPVGDDLLYLAVVEYQGIPYQAVVPGGTASHMVELVIHESTFSQAALRVTDSALIVTGADADSRVLQIFERLTLANTGDTTFVPDLERPQDLNFLRFSLPQGARDLQIGGELRGGQLITVDRGFTLTSPVPPGEFEVDFAYTVPYTGDTLEFTRSFPYATDVFRALLPQQVGRLGMQGQSSTETVSIAGRDYYMSVAYDLAQGTRLQMGVSNLPQPSLAQGVWRGVTQGRYTGTVVASLIGLALAGVLVWGIAGRGRERRAEILHQRGVDVQDARAQRASLVQAIAQMDDLFERRQMPEAQYRQERQALKLRLLRLMALERMASGFS